MRYLILSDIHANMGGAGSGDSPMPRAATIRFSAAATWWATARIRTRSWSGYGPTVRWWCAAITISASTGHGRSGVVQPGGA